MSGEKIIKNLHKIKVEWAMQNVENLITEVLKEQKSLKIEREAIRKKAKEVERKASKICYILYKEFIKNNWDTLCRAGIYYRLRFEDKLVVERIIFDTKYDQVADFHSLDNKTMNINLLKDLLEDDYEAGTVIIDNKQLDWLSQKFEIHYS